MAVDAWTWSYAGYDPDAQRLREALCTLGNGYFATRGAACEARAGAHHYPGTYAAGCYNRLTSRVAGHDTEHEDLVNLPNWLPVHYRLRPAAEQRGAGERDPYESSWLTPDSPELRHHEQRLDLRHGELTRRSAFRDAHGRTLRVEESRLVHMRHPHLAALRLTFTPGDWSGALEIHSGIDGDVRNCGVPRYRRLADRHLTHWRTGSAGNGTVWLQCRTTWSATRIALAARNVLAAPADAPAGAPAQPDVVRRPLLAPRTAGETLRVPVEPGRPVVLEKTVALHTSRDTETGAPLEAAVEQAGTAPGFDRLRTSHRSAWRRLWRTAGLDVPGEAGRILRLHLFHVLQTVSPHTAALDVGVPARGLHGEAYRGHVFWDELFVLPFLNLHLPDASRAALDYRYRRLPRACRNAAEAGRSGAQYPWQSGSDGREESPAVHYNPRSGRWIPDHSRLQHHVGSAVAYNVWRYCRTTQDTAYLHTRGAEMLLEIARFWADGACWDGELGRYRISGVVGPDEFHDGYPGAGAPGLTDNAYTNATAAWVLARALELLDELPAPRHRDLRELLRLTSAETDRWAEVAHGLHIPRHEGVISQFDGYGELAELDWERYRARYGDIRRLDRILEAEGDSVNRYRASKQADVLMLGYLFSPAELRRLFRQLGYELTDADWRATVDYYLRRTSHGSTLSSLVHAWVLARERRGDTWRYVHESLTSDIADLQGGTTEEGIHLGAMAGTLDLLQRGLTGLEPRADGLHLDPVPLPQLSEYGFPLRYRGHWGVDLHVRRDHVRVTVPPSEHAPVRIVLRGRPYLVPAGQSRQLGLES